MARRKRGQDIDGVVLLDKPVGCSSNAALQRVRRAFDARKAGHTGSLDPLASGLLPICLGEATKLSSYLLSADKRYRAYAVFGSETTTGDRDGEVTRRSDTPMPDRDTIEATLRCFTGDQQQIPPMYSALKHNGKRLYEHARAGVTVERRPRAVSVYALTLVDADASGFTIEASVSGGTYIRTLVEDIARAWSGYAHVGSLRRLGVGAFGSAHAMTPLADIEHRAETGGDLTDILLPVSTVIGDWPQAVLDERDIDVIGHGQAVACARPPADPGVLLRLTGADGRLWGLGHIDARGMLAPKRLFTRPQR